MRIDIDLNLKHTNKKTGVTYIYESVSCRDKEKQQARSRQVRIGKIDATTGVLIPSKRLIVPAYYHRIPGNITDAQTIHNLLATFKKLDIKNLHYVLDEVLYVHSRLYPWGDDRRRCCLHLYYNAEHKELYDTFFIITRAPVRGRKILYNKEAVNQYIKRYAGFKALFTTRFDDLKNGLDMKRFRTHTIETVDGRLFVQFIALANSNLKCASEKMRESRLIEKCTIRA